MVITRIRNGKPSGLKVYEGYTFGEISANQGLILALSRAGIMQWLRE